MARRGRRRATALAGLLVACVVLPWWVPAVPQAFTTLYDAALGPDPAPATRVVAPAPRSGDLARDAADGLAVGLRRQQAPSPYLLGALSSRGEPVRVRVPRLRVHAPVRPISGQSGALTPPDDPTVLGWWQEGRPPGAAEGTTVITGHTVHTGGGALDALGTLRRGDVVTVLTRRGTITYEVVWQRDYPTAELARQSRRLFRQELAHPRLLLITCSGWNGQGYDNSAVVFAQPVEEAPTSS